MFVELDNNTFDDVALFELAIKLVPR
jgi:hypothetical protein